MTYSRLETLAKGEAQPTAEEVLLLAKFSWAVACWYDTDEAIAVLKNPGPLVVKWVTNKEGLQLRDAMKFLEVG